MSIDIDALRTAYLTAREPILPALSLTRQNEIYRAQARLWSSVPSLLDALAEARAERDVYLRLANIAAVSRDEARAEVDDLKRRLTDPDGALVEAVAELMYDHLSDHD